MPRQREAKFFECLECKKATLLASSDAGNTCPGCGSANGQVISSADLERRLEEDSVFSIDLSHSGHKKLKR